MGTQVNPAPPQASVGKPNLAEPGQAKAAQEKKERHAQSLVRSTANLHSFLICSIVMKYQRIFMHLKVLKNFV